MSNLNIQQLITVLKGDEHMEVSQGKVWAVEELVQHFAAHRLQHILDSMGHMGMIIQTPILSMLGYFLLRV
jgi:hypothetical protein